MIETKYYCDICGKEAIVKTYMLPEYFADFNFFGSSGNSTHLTDAFIELKKDVCKECIKKISDAIFELKSDSIKEVEKNMSDYEISTMYYKSNLNEDE